MVSASTLTTFLRQAHVFLLLALVLTLLSACGSSKDVTKTSNATVNEVGDAALGSLEDVGIKRDEIPAQLAALKENPYSTPKPLKCKTITTELSKLDILLGPDVDAPKATLSDNEKYAEAGADMIHDGLLGLVRAHTSFIPFRSIVRQITGAAAHEKAVAAAQQAGKLRRAYLKGLASAKFGSSCKLEPAVVTAAADPDKIEDPAAQHLEVATK